LFPPIYKSESQFIAGKSGETNSQISSLAALAGISNSSDAYPSIYTESTIDDLVKSENVLGPLLDEKWNLLNSPNAGSSLYQIFKIDSTDTRPPHAGISRTQICKYKLEKTLQSMIDIEKSPSDIWNLSVYSIDPILSEKLNVAIIQSLKRVAEGETFNRESQNRIFLEGQVDSIKAELQASEKRYAMFLSTNKGQNDPYLEQMRADYSRELEMKESMFYEIQKELESARIQESKEKNFIVIFSNATTPEYKSKPKRLQFAAIGLIFGTAFVCIFFLLKNPKLLDIDK
jgi:uncharacterized protein involved in exopolysaccharide biosynthesis